jgi:hypothetical protein
LKRQDSDERIQENPRKSKKIQVPLALDKRLSEEGPSNSKFVVEYNPRGGIEGFPKAHAAEMLGWREHSRKQL